MRNLNSTLLAASASLFFSCKEAPERVNAQTLTATCDQVHSNVEGIYFALPAQGKVQADAEQKKCEAMSKEDQEKLLEDSRRALEIAASRALPR